MKKLIALMVAIMIAVPVVGAELGGSIDLNYMMDSYADDAVAAESYFQAISTKLWITQALENDVNAKIKLSLPSTSNGVNTVEGLNVEEMYVSKAKPFGVEALSLTFGKMEIPFNLDYDTNITHNYSNAIEMDETWGLTGSYDLGGEMGKISLTTFEGMGGTDISGTDPEDEDAGLFTSMALQWDTGKGVNAFGVAGLRLVVGYAAIAADEDADNGSIISIGATYELADLGLMIGFEYDILTDIFSPEGSTIMALNADYKIDDTWAVGLTYENANVSEDTATLVPEMKMTRIALRGTMAVGEAASMRFEYSTEEDSEVTDSGTTKIAIGYMSTF
jgi:hypothetical protein